jgi:hypothetical protein
VTTTCTLTRQQLIDAMIGIVESRVRPNVYAICSIPSDTTEQACKDIADELLIRLSARVLGSGAEQMIPAGFTLERCQNQHRLHALVRCPEKLSIGDFSRMLADEWRNGSWASGDIQIRLRDAGCVRQAATHGLDTFLITT